MTTSTTSRDQNLLDTRRCAAGVGRTEFDDRLDRLCTQTIALSVTTRVLDLPSINVPSNVIPTVRRREPPLGRVELIVDTPAPRNDGCRTEVAINLKAPHVASRSGGSMFGMGVKLVWGSTALFTEPYAFLRGHDHSHYLLHLCTYQQSRACIVRSSKIDRGGVML